MEWPIKTWLRPEVRCGQSIEIDREGRPLDESTKVIRKKKTVKSEVTLCPEPFCLNNVSPHLYGHESYLRNHKQAHPKEN